ncbi:MAG: hypothetical protein R2748_19765 [Bryobacterales bacterium]
MPRSESCPGLYLRVQVDTGHSAAAGMPAEATVVFEDDSASSRSPGRQLHHAGGDRALSGGRHPRKWLARGERHFGHIDRCAGGGAAKKDADPVRLPPTVSRPAGQHFQAFVIQRDPDRRVNDPRMSEPLDSEAYQSLLEQGLELQRRGT